jgi:hypothetical protein
LILRQICWRRERDSVTRCINRICKLQIPCCRHCHKCQECRAALPTIAHGAFGSCAPVTTLTLHRVPRDPDFETENGRAKPKAVKCLQDSGFCARSVSSWRRKPVNHRDGRIHVFGVWLPECRAETKSRIEKQGQSTFSRGLTGGGISDLRPEIRLSPAFTLHGSAATRRLTEINSAKLLASRRLRKCTASWPMRELGSKTEFCGGRSFAQSHGILGSARAEHQRLFRS